MLHRLQSLRALAALAVMAFHYTEGLRAFPDWQWLFRIFWTVGFAGVDVFFVISGYIITKTYQESNHHPLAFLARRYVRIFSGYWPVLLGFVALHMIFRQPLGNYDLLKSLFLWPQDITKNPIGVVWSLYSELSFYLLFACFFLLPAHYRRPAFLAGLTALMALYLLCYFAGYYDSMAQWEAMPLIHGDRYGWMHRTFAPYILEFIAGALLYHYRHSLKGKPWMLWVGIAGMLIAGIINVAFFGGLMGKVYFRFQRVLLVLLPSCLLVLWGSNPQNARKGVLSTIGDASYSLYLIHCPILATANWIGLQSLQSRLAYVGGYVLCAAVSIGLALVVYRFVEHPLYRAMRVSWLPLSFRRAAVG